MSTPSQIRRAANAEPYPNPTDNQSKLPPAALESAFNGRMEQRFFHSPGMAKALGYDTGLKRYYSEEQMLEALSGVTTKKESNEAK